MYGTDPVAGCIPTSQDPVLFDFATSATSNRMVERALRASSLLPSESLVEAGGRPGADPARLGEGGAIAPMGGEHWGHKGFALALLNEALTGALAGTGRATTELTGQPAGSACFLQIMDPEGFAGRERFLREMDALARAVRTAPAARGTDGPRMPGERAFTRRRQQMEDGLGLHPDVPPLLMALAGRYGVSPPPVLEQP